jgi:hypothetical protein
MAYVRRNNGVARPNTPLAIVVAAGVSLLLAATLEAQTVNRCQSKKKLCVATEAAGLLKCHVNAEKLGDALDPACIERAHDHFDGGSDPARGCFEKLEAQGGCVTLDDTPTLGAEVDAFVNDVVTALDPSYPTPVANSCSAAKKKCVATKAKSLLKCHAKAERTGVLSARCVQKARDKFDGGSDPSRGCFAKLESLGGCLTTNDASVLEGKVDGFVQAVVCDLDAPDPICIPTPIVTPTPGGPCPSTYQLTVDGAASDVDLGWTGFAHDTELTSNARLTLAVGSCANPVTPCGQCSLSGLLTNAGGAAFANRRCRGDGVGANGTWVPCTSDADCPGAGNACVFFLGPPHPINAGGLPLCTLYEIPDPVSGTLNSDTGAALLTMDLSWTVYVGQSFSDPCPRCELGTCNGGERNGGPCTVQGTNALYSDAVSLDCPPARGFLLNLPPPVALTLSTGAQSSTLSAVSPNCRAVGYTDLKCQCDTCNNLAATPCHTHNDCVAVGASVCGGKRCLVGGNAGAPCLTNSECPGGGCDVPGVRTQPNDCFDATCSPNPGDTGSSDEGVCADGPAEQRCAIERFRGCVSDGDCTAPGDSCTTVRVRECFLDNGVSGNSTSASGVASVSAPTFAGLTCLRPSSSLYLNSIGIPGLARFTLRTSAVQN